MVGRILAQRETLEGEELGEDGMGKWRVLMLFAFSTYPMRLFPGSDLQTCSSSFRLVQAGVLATRNSTRSLEIATAAIAYTESLSNSVKRSNVLHWLRRFHRDDRACTFVNCTG